MYFFVYTPSNQHFKAFLVSKFNSETSFLYQTRASKNHAFCPHIFSILYSDCNFNGHVALHAHVNSVTPDLR